MSSVEEKYRFLCSRLRITNVDFWEGDALLEFKPVCFCLPSDPNAAGWGYTEPRTIDEAVELAVSEASER
jgi:hypothetical protein